MPPVHGFASLLPTAALQDNYNPKSLSFKYISHLISAGLMIAAAKMQINRTYMELPHKKSGKM
jgi:hypothetical protein